MVVVGAAVVDPDEYDGLDRKRPREIKEKSVQISRSDQNGTFSLV